MVASGFRDASESGALIAALKTEGGFNQRLRRYMDAAGTGTTLIEGLDRPENGA